MTAPGAIRMRAARERMGRLRSAAPKSKICLICYDRIGDRNKTGICRICARFIRNGRNRSCPKCHDLQHRRGEDANRVRVADQCQYCGAEWGPDIPDPINIEMRSALAFCVGPEADEGDDLTRPRARGRLARGHR